MTQGYRFELLELTQDELRRTSELLRIVFPGAKYLTQRYLDWQYVQNPDGRAVGCNAWLGDELVGHMSATPLRAKMDGSDVRGIFTVQGAVHPAHRGKKLQSGISHAIFEDAARQGYAFCFATGNKYSTGPLLTRFRMVAPLDARIGYGVPQRREEVFEPGFQRVWSDEAMRWRLANPERPYRIGGEGDALTITAPTGKPGVGAVLYSGRDAWNLPRRGADLPGHGPLKVWIGLDPAVDWAKSSYVSIPMRLRPSPLNLVFKDFTGGNLHPDAVRTVWRTIDFDPY